MILEKWQETLANCPKCNHVLLSVKKQEIKYSNSSILLGCKNCFKSGYKQWLYVDDSLKDLAKKYEIKLEKRKKYEAITLEQAIENIDKEVDCSINDAVSQDVKQVEKRNSDVKKRRGRPKKSV